jgi:hypothetical protein
MENESLRMNPGRIAMFDGYESKFRICWHKFRSYVYLDGFGEEFVEEKDPQSPRPHTL